jgi:hypothetical protein
LLALCPPPYDLIPPSEGHIYQVAAVFIGPNKPNINSPKSNGIVNCTNFEVSLVLILEMVSTQAVNQHTKNQASVDETSNLSDSEFLHRVNLQRTAEFLELNQT